MMPSRSYAKNVAIEATQIDVLEEVSLCCLIKTVDIFFNEEKS